MRLPISRIFSLLALSLPLVAAAAGTVTSFTTGYIYPFAGTGTAAYAGDAGQAISAQLTGPYGVAVDASGTVYIADKGNNVIRAVAATTGVITTVAGSGAAGYAGDNGLATAAKLNAPASVAVDSAGNLYIAEQNNNVIRMVTAATGVISTLAGTGAAGYAGDNDLATSAQLSGPLGVAVDAAGNVFIADTLNDRVRKVAASTGVITTVAGTGDPGYSGDRGLATAAQLQLPAGVFVDSAGNIYVADWYNNRVRMVAAATGIITTLAGTGTAGSLGNNGQAVSAQLSQPTGVTVDSAGNIYIADLGNNRIRKIVPTTGIITTLAGTGASGNSGDSALATAALLTSPSGVAISSAGNLYLAASANNRVRFVAVVMTPQSITPATAPTLVVAGTGTLAATASSGLAVSFASATPSVCTVSGSTVTGVAVGSCNISVNQAGNATYLAAPTVTQTIAVAAASQTITFAAQAGRFFSPTPFVLSPLATASSGLAVSYTSITPTVCSVSGASVTMVGIGQCTIAADQAGNANYLAAPQVTQNIVISKVAQTINFGAQTGQVYGSAPFQLFPLASASSGLTVVYSSLTTAVCSVSGSAVTILGAGKCTIAADQEGNALYNAAPQATQNINIDKASQTVTFAAQARQTVGTFTLNPLAKASSGLEVSYAATTPKVCTVSGTTVTALTVGTCTISAGQTGTANYYAAVVVLRDIAIGQGPTPICTLTASPSSILAGGNVVLTATCNPAATSYVWSSNSGFGASVAAGTVSPTVASTYTVAGVNANGTGSLARVTVTMAVPWTITVARAGTGFGTVTSSPAGISCGTSCSGSFAGGTQVTLTATPAAGSTFAGWSGDCSGAGTCLLTMNAARSVTASFKPLPFVANTTTIITPTSASIATTISFARADVGKTGAVFITAWVPVAGLAALGITTSTLSQSMSVTTTNDDPNLVARVRPRQATLGSVTPDPNAFVLVQLTTTGWQVVENGQLIPYATGVLGDSLAAQNILSNADPSKLSGAQFCVGYGASAAEMLTSGRIYPVASIPGADASPVTSGSCNVAAAPYSGLWWNPNESGWGMSITQHGSTIFAVPFTYDATGQSTWYALPSCPIVSAGSCSGKLYQVTGGSSPAVAWDGSAKATASAGTATLTFSDADNASFDFIMLNGGLGHKSIQRQRFANGTAQLAVDYTDLWWNPDESGWGVALTQDHGIIFAAWYAYDAAGRATWYVASSCPLQSGAAGYGCSGDLYQVSGGSPLASTWSPNISAPKVGSVSFAFADANTAQMSYTLNGVAGTRTITRQGF